MRLLSAAGNMEASPSTDSATACLTAGLSNVSMCGAVAVEVLTTPLGTIEIRPYQDESQIDTIMDLVSKELSEPYSIFTYRFFLSGWPELCFLAHHADRIVGVIVCKSEKRRERTRGYVAMLVIDPICRKCGIGMKLAAVAIRKMKETCDEVVLETEVTNGAALSLYETLGFIRDKRLPSYYLNGNDAYRLKCWFK